MPSKVELWENGRILYAYFASPLTKQEVDDAYKADQQFRDTATHGKLIHTLVDNQKVTQVPINTLRNLSPSFKHRNAGVIAIVAGKSFAYSVAKTAFRIAHFKRFKIFDTEDEALNYLKDLIAAEETADTAKAAVSSS